MLALFLFSCGLVCSAAAVDDDDYSTVLSICLLLIVVVEIPGRSPVFCFLLTTPLRWRVERDACRSVRRP